MITQIKEETLQFPPGVALTLQPHQKIRLEAHFINYTPTEITAEASVEFTTIDPADVVHHTELLFYGDLDINLPWGQETVVGPTFLPVDPALKIFAMTGHTHRFGMDVSAWKTTDGAPDEDIYVFGDYNWEEPPIKSFDPSLTFAEGEGLTLQCTYFNDAEDGKSVGFGESSNDEMCFVWAYFYPAEAFQICVKSDLIQEYLGVDTICCPQDETLCALLPLAQDYL
jgi:hypothetical protein